LLENYDIFQSNIISSLAKHQSMLLLVKEITSENESLRRELAAVQNLVKEREDEILMITRNRQDMLQQLNEGIQHFKKELIYHKDFINMKYEIEIALSSKRSAERDLMLQKAEYDRIVHHNHTLARENSLLKRKFGL
jgi:hypothetical protein